jgi:hypothetical protein
LAFESREFTFESRESLLASIGSLFHLFYFLFVVPPAFICADERADPILKFDVHRIHSGIAGRDAGESRRGDPLGHRMAVARAEEDPPVH